jgi:flagellar hook assembly protein FlgD
MASGRFSAQWDGRDSSGKLLPPGLYLLRLSVEADKGEDARQAILSIVY